MNFNTKANNMFYIIGISEYKGQEVIDTATSRIAAIRLAHEYQMAFGNKWVIKFRELKAAY
jgi:hypothetical protein